MSKIIIKPMENEAEMQGKARVHYQSWQETYRGQLSDEYLDQMSFEKCLAITRRWPERTIVALDGDTVVGFACYAPYGGDDLQNIGEICALYVLASHQKQKIGYRLMQAAIACMPEYDRIALWVLKGNQKAIPFYQRFGFSFDGKEKKLLIGTHVTEQRMIYQKV
jgi:GNAT superfamily N-acetyltransferase